MLHKTSHTLRLAPSFKGLYSFFGMFLIIISAVMIYVENTVLGACLFILGIQMFLNIKGVLYSEHKRAIQTFTVYFGLRIGTWTPVTDVYSVEIRKRKDLLKEHTSNYSKTRYQVVLIFTKRNDVVVKSYIDKHKAVRFMKNTAELLGVEHNHLSK